MSENPPAVLDRAQLRNITMDDEELMREIVGQLIDDAARQIGALEEAFGRSDATACARSAHSAKGACGNVGAASLAALFAAVERDAQQGQLERCGGLLRGLAVELEKLKAEAGKL
ncbi:MAG: Hpt domain-containing protein [Bryobacteraceae bacterium]